jgi:hypothetical protein
MQFYHEFIGTKTAAVQEMSSLTQSRFLNFVHRLNKKKRDVSEAAVLLRRLKQRRLPKRRVVLNFGRWTVFQKRRLSQ